MNLAAPSRVANVTLGTLNALQDWSPEEQLLGAACVFMHLSEFYGVSPQDAFTAISNMVSDKDRKARPEFHAIRPYMEGELQHQ